MLIKFKLPVATKSNQFGKTTPATLNTKICPAGMFVLNIINKGTINEQTDHIVLIALSSV